MSEHGIHFKRFFYSDPKTIDDNINLMFAVFKMMPCSNNCRSTLNTYRYGCI